MPQDPNLYGQRPVKRQKKDNSLSSSLDFTAQLTSLMSSANGQPSSSGRPRPGKERKDSIFKSSSKPRKMETTYSGGKPLSLKEIAGTSEETEELSRARRKMEDKARLYAAMKRGDYVAKDNEAEPLIDFDKKWAENADEKDGHETSSDEADEGVNDEIIEYEDEFGRMRRGTRSEKERIERRARRGLLGAEELERMSARPSAPSNLIYGDAVQAMAFNPEDADKMEELARKRDRSATPPDQKHYDADSEIRNKGTGFFKFSQDEETRTKEMKELEEERQRTEQQRQAREDQKAARRRDIEERRRGMAARKAQRQADSFLDDMGNVGGA